MSYILQALKKAEAERGLGRVPGLESPAPLASAPGLTPARWWPWLVLACLASAVLAAALWRWWPAASAVQAVPVRAAASAATVAPAPAPPSIAVAPMQVSRPSPPPVNAAPVPPLPPTASPTAAPVLAAAQPLPAPAPTASRPATKLAPSPPPPLWPTGPGWPSLSVNGSVYADEPAQRILIVNGQVLREGDAAGTELTLVSIGPKSAVLRYKGTTYLWRY